MSKLHKCLLAVEVYEFTGEDIGKLRKQYKHDRYLDKILPKYTYNTNTNCGTLIDSPGFLQFIEDGDEKFVLFDVSTVDPLLKEEMSMGGLDGLLDDIDLRPWIDKFTKRTYDDFQRCFDSAEYLIIGLEYFGGGYYNPDDVDLHVTIEGALVGNDLTLIKSV
jgi:hypothetical protein